MSRERFEPGLMPGLLIIVLALALAVFGELRDCSPPVYDRNGELVTPRCS